MGGEGRELLPASSMDSESQKFMRTSYSDLGEAKVALRQKNHAYN